METEHSRTDRYIQLKAVNPLLASILINQDLEIDAIRARMTPEQFAGMEREAQRLSALRRKRDARMS